MKVLDPHLLAGGARRVRISGSPGRARGQGEWLLWGLAPQVPPPPHSHPHLFCDLLELQLPAILRGPGPWI